MTSAGIYCEKCGKAEGSCSCNSPKMIQPRKPRGLANVSKERRIEIARMGGTASSQDKERMAEMGRRNGRIFAAIPGHMSKLGRLGGLAAAATPGHMSKIGRIGGKLTQKKMITTTGISKEFYSPFLSLFDHENMIIKECVEYYHGNKTHAAKALGISCNKVKYRMKKYNLWGQDA